MTFYCVLLQLFAYDTVKKHLTPKPGDQPMLPIPASSVAGAVAGVSSTLLTYPLELLKTRLTIQVKARTLNKIHILLIRTYWYN